jgi:hypothetical protein
MFHHLPLGYHQSSPLTLLLPPLPLQGFVPSGRAAGCAAGPASAEAVLHGRGARHAHLGDERHQDRRDRAGMYAAPSHFSLSMRHQVIWV